MKWSAKELFLKAGLCRICTKDLVAARRAIDNYTNVFAGFRDTREDAFLKNILLSVEEGDQEKFTKVRARVCIFVLVFVRVERWH
jgi:alpha-soluble NSF attachment protein